MRKFLIASHGNLSGSILESAALIAGKAETTNVAVIQVRMEDSSDKIKQAIEDKIGPFDKKEEIIALTDVLGGNVTNILCEYAHDRNLHIITGVNLGMVLELILSCQTMPMDELVDYIVSVGRNGIVYVNGNGNRREDNEI